MSVKPKPMPGAPLDGQGRERLNADLLRAAYTGSLGGVDAALAEGAAVAAIDAETGLTALHIAVGTNNLALCRYLIDEWHAPFSPDKFGRWPTLIAAECQVDDELSDYLVEAEAKFLAENPS